MSDFTNSGLTEDGEIPTPPFDNEVSDKGSKRRQSLKNRNIIDQGHYEARLEEAINHLLSTYTPEEIAKLREAELIKQRQRLNHAELLSTYTPEEIAKLREAELIKQRQRLNHADLRRERSGSPVLSQLTVSTTDGTESVSDTQSLTGNEKESSGNSLALNETSLGCFLLGTLRKDCSLAILRGQFELLKIIWTIACEERLEKCILPFTDEIPYIRDIYEGDGGGLPAVLCNRGVVLPEEEEGLNVNMFPFVLRDVETLPYHLRKYYPIIEMCIEHTEWSMLNSTDVGYLTIDTRPVTKEGTSQRRAGVHVEAPAVFEELPHTIPGSQFGWGHGTANMKMQGGIFMMSDVDNSTAIYNMTIHDPYNKGKVIGPHGNVERMKDLLGEPAMILKAGDLIWMTDRTPHESLPIPAGKRHYFRLVLPEISGWFKDHSTANPDVPIPDHIQVIEGNKFELVDRTYSLGDKTALWQTATEEELEIAEKKKDLYLWLKRYKLAHLFKNCMKMHLISIEHLAGVDMRFGTRPLFMYQSDRFRSLFDGTNFDPRRVNPPHEYHVLLDALRHSKETRRMVRGQNP